MKKLHDDCEKRKIYVANKILGERQESIAKRFYYSQSTISNIIKFEEYEILKKYKSFLKIDKKLNTHETLAKETIVKVINLSYVLGHDVETIMAKCLLSKAQVESILNDLVTPIHEKIIGGRL